MKYCLDRTEYFAELWNTACHPSEKDFDPNGKYGLIEPINPKPVHYKLILILTGSILILFAVVWYKFL